MRALLVLAFVVGCASHVIDPARPLGAACTSGDQCASSVCTSAGDAGSGVCCDRPDDACNACAEGRVAPVADNTPCGAGMCYDSGTISNRYCVQGACVVKTIDCCRGCSGGTLAPGCYMRDDGIAACGCFVQAGFFCKG